MPKPIRAYKVLVEPEDLSHKLRRWTKGDIGKHKKPGDAKTDLPQAVKETSSVSDKKRLLTF